MSSLIFFHRGRSRGFSIHKVMRTVITKLPTYREYDVPYIKPTLKAIIGNLIYVFRHRQKDAIHHVTGDIHYCILALLGCKSVLTVHDTVSVDFHNISFLKKKIIEWLWYRLPLRFASRVICISEETKKAVQRFTKRTDLIVIHNAVDPLIETQEIKALGCPVKILLIGTNPNKNLIRTFEALRGLDCRVTVVGSLNNEQSKSLAENGIPYVDKFNLSDEEIRKEYYACDIVSFCSLFEGFGMPVIEANKAGKPVVCSDIPVLREVAGNAAHFVNPFDSESINAAFTEIINHDDRRRTLIDLGIKNARRFDADTILRKWTEIYKNL